MGFSEIAVSAVLFSTFLLMAGVLGASYFNYLDELSEAKKINAEILSSKVHTIISILNATYNSSSGILIITFENRGDTVLNLDLTNILVDGTFIGNVTEYTYTVSTASSTTKAFPGERVTVTISLTSAPTRVAIVTEYGVAAYANVTIV